MRVFAIILIITIFSTTNFAQQPTENNSKEDPQHWLNLGKNDIKEAVKAADEIIKRPAKNVIIFVGDGMGMTTVTTSRIYGKGEDEFLSFERFPHVGTLKTYNADTLVPDSCSTATALFCGVKANLRTSGVDATVPFADCPASLRPEARLRSILDWAQEAGKGTGLVTTTRVTHATPSALYAHTPDRNWECADKIPPEGRGCKDIARQLIEDVPGRRINVIMGGGRQVLQTNISWSDEDPRDMYSCYSTDGRDLIRDWYHDKDNRGFTYAMLNNNEDLETVDLDMDYVLGIFANGHLATDHVRDRGPKGMPSLLNMTEKAIRLLSRRHGTQGYVLVVEGGLIDLGHHRGHARRALDETVAFGDAIEAALNLVDVGETLVIVTSDHSHSLVFGGSPQRNDSNIFGAQQSSKIDGVPYTSLLYGTGGPNNFQLRALNGSVVRDDPSVSNTEDFEYSQQAAILTDEVTHDGTDVLVYAKGPMAHLFHSTHEQTYVAYVVGYAAQIGPFKDNSNEAIVPRSGFTLLSLVVMSVVVILV